MSELQYLRSPFALRAADRLAYECARIIQAGHLDSRSGIGDALLDYLEIGAPGGPSDVPAWIRKYESKQNTKASDER